MIQKDPHRGLKRVHSRVKRVGALSARQTSRLSAEFLAAQASETSNKNEVKRPGARFTQWRGGLRGNCSRNSLRIRAKPTGSTNMSSQVLGFLIRPLLHKSFPKISLWSFKASHYAGPLCLHK